MKPSLIKTSLYFFFIFLEMCNALQVLKQEYYLKSGDGNGQNNETVVEVAIFCDYDCTKNFEHQYRILHYWQHLFWDVHWRYSNKLPDVNVSFRVTSIVLLQRGMESEAFQALQKARGKMEELQWSFVNELRLVLFHMPSFDIPIISVSGNMPDDIDDGKAPTETGFCWRDKRREEILCPAIVSLRSQDPAGDVALQIAQILKNGFLNDNLKGKCSENPNDSQAFFPPCTNTVLSEILQENKSKFQKHQRQYPLVDTKLLANGPSPYTSKSIKGFSVKEQCQMIAKSPSADVATYEDDTTCRRPICYYGPVEEREGIAFTPFEWSECTKSIQGEIMKGRCFRGICLPQGLRLVNSATRSCLGNTDPMEKSDTAVMKDCSDVASSPFDMIRLAYQHMNIKGAFMLTASSAGTDFPPVPVRCLTIAPEEENGRLNVKFEEETSLHCFNGWEFVLADEKTIWSEQEFMLYHRATRRCVAAAGNHSMEVTASRNCSLENNLARWRLLKEDGKAMIPGEEMEGYVRRDKVPLLEQLVCFLTFDLLCR